MARAVVSVPGLHCEGCSRIIRHALVNAPGVGALEVDVAGKRVTLEYDGAQITLQRVEELLRAAGFECRCEDGGTGSDPRLEDRAPQVTPTARAVALTGSGFWYALLVMGVAVLAIAGYVGYELYPRFNLPGIQGAGLLLLAVGAGIASFFSPCAFPLLVALLARETGAMGPEKVAALGTGLRSASALSLGAAAFVSLAGIGIALGGGALFGAVTFTSAAGMTIRAVVGAFLITMGLVQLGVLPNPLHAVERLSLPLMRRQGQLRRRKPTAGFALFGFAYLLAGFG